jgi:hypothetical protein
MTPSGILGALAGCGVVMALASPAATASADRPSRQVTAIATASSSTDPLDVSTPPHSGDAYVLASRDTKSTQTSYLARRHNGHWSTLPGSSIDVLTKKSNGAAVGVRPDNLAALSAHSIWLTGRGPRGHAVILHYTGNSYHRAKLPPLSNNETRFADITARSKNDVWVVGDTQVPRTHFAGGVLLHYNGHRWSRVTSPRFKNVDFESVARAGHSVWILGNTLVGGVRGHVIIKADGTHVTEHQTPLDVGDATLRSIAAGSHHRVWVVGYRNSGTELSPDYHPVSAFWNGSRFRVVNPHRPAGRSFALFDVTAVSGSKAVAVGSSVACTSQCAPETFTGSPIAYRWNGSWRRAGTPHGKPYSSEADFARIARLPGGHAITVGNAVNGSGEGVGITGLYNGHSFTKASGTVPPLRHN